jgi:calcineurin-like phosphoesterase family protein
MGNILIASDHHFNHSQPFIWQARGFNSIDEMNEELIKRHNQLTTHNDEIYLLGDCMLGPDIQQGLSYLRRLNGVKFLVIGNHDTNARIDAYRASGIFADIQFGYRLHYKGMSFYLSHYPTLTANYDDDKPLKAKTINLCGHSHTNDKFQDFNNNLIYHCELDAHNYYPVPLDTIITDIKEKYNERKHNKNC